MVLGENERAQSPFLSLHAVAKVGCCVVKCHFSGIEIQNTRKCCSLFTFTHILCDAHVARVRHPAYCPVMVCSRLCMRLVSS